MFWLSHHWQRKSLISWLLLPVSVFYCLIIFLRIQLYKIGVFKKHTLSVPVIVVGNVTIGGTGKTPLVIWLAGLLSRTGYKPGVVSRGYRGTTREWPKLVDQDADSRLVGDEPVLLARHCHCPVMVDPVRVRAAQCLIDDHGCTVIIADDGLQHYALARDIEIAVLDGARRFGNGFCLPAGPLREPKSRLKRVDLQVVNGTAQDGAGQNDELSMCLQTTTFVCLGDKDQQADATRFRGRPVHALAGIGNPERFFGQLKSMGLDIIPHPLDDHHDFIEADLQFDDGEDDKLVIMTEKDAVKCERFHSLVNNAPDRYWYLAVEAELDNRVGQTVLNLLSEISNHG